MVAQPSIPPERRRQFRRRLLDWFDRHQRNLPWRHSRDPYLIWVSEVMLQQTQVATVVPYFERFLRRFPTLADLAGATEHEVLQFWEGLGYYRRARDLLRTARLLGERHDGRFPTTAAELTGLPGMGRYTINAVLSQAFDARLPILEANSQRVLSRLFGRREDPRGGPERRWLWAAAEHVLPRKRVGAFNQALMELGALVCTPRAPRCEACPLAELCEARRLGIQDQVPPKAAAPVLTEVQEAAVVVQRGDEVLLVQRPDTGRWASLWELPHAPLDPGETPADAAARLVPQLTGLHVYLGPELLTVRHGITRYRITLTCYEAAYQKGSFRSAFYQASRWLPPTRLCEFPVSAPQRRLARVLAAGPRQRRLF